MLDTTMTSDLRVAIGTTVLNLGRQSGGLDGIGNYTDHLLQALCSMSHIGVTGFAYGANPALPVSDAGEDLAAAEPTVCDVGAFRSQAMFALAFGRRFAGFDPLLQSGVDVVHATDHLVPKLKGVPVLATVMDMIPLSHPHWVDYPFKRVFNAAWRQSLRWADRIVTISDYSKHQIAEHLRFDPNKIDVVPLGVDARWFETPTASALEQVRKKFGLPGQYLLTVGTIQPRKNLFRLIRAHRALPEDVRRQFPLVIVGRYGWGESELLAMLQAQSDIAVKWLKYVPGVDLHLLMAGAAGFVFPSLLEGFGLPLLEAFAAGTPVAASGTTAIPEVTGDAALLFDPESVDDMTAALLRLSLNRSADGELIERGRQRARAYTWKRTAAQTLECYQRLAGS